MLRSLGMLQALEAPFPQPRPMNTLERLARLETRADQTQRDLDELHAAKIRVRLDRLEQQMETHDRRAAPWRTVATIVFAGILTAAVSWIAVEHIRIEQHMYTQEHQTP